MLVYAMSGPEPGIAPPGLLGTVASLTFVHTLFHREILAPTRAGFSKSSNQSTILNVFGNFYATSV